jgi:hypothetical protein
MNKGLIGLAALPFLANVASAGQPTLLSDAQIDRVTAGTQSQISSFNPTAFQSQTSSFNPTAFQSQTSSFNPTAFQSQTSSFNPTAFQSQTSSFNP